MTTHEARQKTHVRTFTIDEDGIYIRYNFDGKLQTIDFPIAQSATALLEAGIIDGYSNGLIAVEGEVMSWDDYAEVYGLWQHAALLIAINHELAKDQEKQLHGLDMLSLAEEIVMGGMRL